MAAVSVLLLLVSSCANKTPNAASPATAAATSASGVSAATGLFVDAAERAGVRFVHTNGAEGKFRFIESTPAGCAFFDYDNDGFLDIFLVQSGPSTPVTSPGQVKRPSCALYRNNGDGTFTDVSKGSGLDADLGYGHGVAVGDYDNDGYDDLFVTGFAGNHLLRNERGTGKFRDVTRAMGLGAIHSTGYATSAAFGDYDNDGRLDLYVCYYCPWSWANNKPCRDAHRRPDYCSPEVYDPDVHRLYRNTATGFVDVSEKAGLTRARGRGLAVAFIDYDGDGRPDIFVANDLTPNMLWRNNGDGTFTDKAAAAGCSYAEGGTTMAGMGVAIGDYDRSGRDSVFVTNFSNMPNCLFKNVGDGLFEDVSAVSGVAFPHMKFLAFGCEFFDYDADGWLDLLVANGHVNIHADTLFEGVTYKQRKQLFHNERDGRFREITEPNALEALGVPTVSRGLAVGDYDNDGRVDALVNNQNGPAQLLHNNDRSANHWISFKTIGVKSNRNGVHARLTLVASDGSRQTATVRGGSSYLSYSDRRVYFGLGTVTGISQVEIRWPSGVRDVLKNVAPDAIYVVTEGRGITGKQPAPARDGRTATAQAY